MDKIWDRKRSLAVVVGMKKSRKLKNKKDPKRYSEPIRSQENKRVFFTSISNGFDAHHTGFSFQAIVMAATPIRQGTVNHSVHLDTIDYVMLMAPTPTKHDTVNHIGLDLTIDPASPPPRGNFGDCDFLIPYGM